MHGGHTLEMGAALVLLQGRRLQHEVLLLGRVHLLQKLGRHVLWLLDSMLDDL